MTRGSEAPRGQRRDNVHYRVLAAYRSWQLNSSEMEM